MQDFLREATPPDLEALGALLDAAARKLLQKGVCQWSCPFDRAALAEDIRRRRVYLLGGAEPAATFSLMELQHSSLWPAMPEIRGYLTGDIPTAGPGVFYLYRLAVHPRLQGRGYGRRLLDCALGLARPRGLPVYLDCWAGNAKLRAFYVGCGFRHLCDVSEPGENYRISVFFSGAL